MKTLNPEDRRMRALQYDFYVVVVLCTTGELSVFDAESYYDRATWGGGISPHKAVFQGSYEQCNAFLKENKDTDLSKLPTFSFMIGYYVFIRKNNPQLQK